MTCSRCHAPMFLRRVEHLSTVDADFWKLTTWDSHGYYCPCCGNYEDEVILYNRHAQQKEVTHV